MTCTLFGCVMLRWPISAAAAADSRRTAVRPARPATQASESASRLSSCNCATLTCSIRLPCGNDLVERRRVRRLRQGLAQRAIAEHLRQLGKDLEVPFGGVLRNEQREHEAYRLAVRGVERNRLRKA